MSGDGAGPDRDRGAGRRRDDHPGGEPPAARDPERDTSRQEVGAPDSEGRPPGPAGRPQPAGRVPQRLPRRGAVPWEAQLFARMAAFGIVVGAGYWFLTYETAGSVLLFTFGVASAVAGIAIFAGSVRARRHGAADGRAIAAAAESELEPVPGPNYAPFLLATGLGLVALGTVLGPWLMIAGLLVVLAAAWSWLGAAMDETDDARGLMRSRPED